MTVVTKLKKVELLNEINYQQDILIKNVSPNTVLDNLAPNKFLYNFLKNNFPLERCNVMDLKLHKLSKGDNSCFNMDWHYDFSRDFDNDKPIEENYIWINKYPTEFKEGGFLEEQTLYSYERDIHRGVTVPQNCLRLLIRMSKSWIRPIKLDIKKLKLLEDSL